MTLIGGALLRRFLFILILLFAFTAAGADHIPESVRAELASLEQQYGVKFLIGEDVPPDNSGYVVSEYDPQERQGNLLHYMLTEKKTVTADEQWCASFETLSAALARFPEGFLAALKDPLTICVSGSIRDPESSTLLGGFAMPQPAGRIYLNADNLSSDTVFHEIWHGIDLQQKDAFTTWNGLNPEGFAYTGDYVNYRSSPAFDPEYFAQPYGTVSPYEDRATLFEAYMQNPPEWWEAHPKLQRKLEVMLKAVGWPES